MGVRRAGVGLAALVLLAGLAHGTSAATPAQRFLDAGGLARAGDTPGAIAIYDSLARAGFETAALDWNRAQAEAARGAQGEALWALLRARELAPADGAVAREIERLRENANLDRAELAPDPLAAVSRASRRFRLDLVACALLLVSLAARLGPGGRHGARGRPAGVAWVALALGLSVASLPVAGSLARPTGVVVRRGAPLLDGASPTAEAATLREGEVVPILERGGGYVRVEDSSGARGWALGADVRPLTGRGGGAS